MTYEKIKVFSGNLSGGGNEEIEEEVNEWLNTGKIRVVSRSVNTDYVVDKTLSFSHIHKITITLFYVEI